MDPIVEPNDPTLGQAMEALSSMETADASPAEDAVPPAELASASPEAERAASSDSTKVQPPKADANDGAPATEDLAKPDKDKQAETETQAKPGEKPQSRFEKNRVRLEGGWKELNAEKTATRTLADTLKERQAELDKREATIKASEAKANAPRYTADDYDQAAKQFEDQGKYDMADAAREQAKELRAHPPQPAPTDAQAEARYKADQKEWWGKAATDFPAVAKPGSPQHEALQSLIKAEPAILNDPRGLYYAARLANAETSAASVPALTQQVSELNAKVKELQSKLAIPSDGLGHGPTPPLSFDQKSESEQEAELYATAKEIGSFN